MAVKSIVQLIVASRRDLTREEIIKMIEEKMKSAKGYITPEIAAQMVASELGLKAPRKSLQPKILIMDIVSGLNDVTVTGRIVHVSPFQRFARSDGTVGAVKRLLIADRSATMKVVLWDEKAELAEDKNVKPDQILRFSHGYAREGLDGEIELSLGMRGEIEVLPADELKDEYPPIENFIKKIAEIAKKNRRVNVLGVVQRVFPESAFERKNGSKGKTRRLWLRDSTRKIRVVFWNDKVEDIKNLRTGDSLRIINARVRSQLDGQLELHVEENSNVEVITGKAPGLMLPRSMLMKIKGLKQGMRDIDVVARVVEVGEIRKFKRSSGEFGCLSQILLEDETGSIQLNLWGDKAIISKQIKAGDAVLVEGAYIRERFERISLNLDSRGSITVNPNIKGAENLPQHVEEITKIREIREGRHLTIQGKVATKPLMREITTSRNENVKVTSFELSDETGKIELSFWRRFAETAEKLSIGDEVKVRNIYVKRDQSGGLRPSSTMLTSIQKVSKEDLGNP